MQSYEEQAAKRNIIIKENGPCQFCDAQVENGVKECIELSTIATHFLNHDRAIKTNCLFLAVDAHALSHTEIHGRWNNHFHQTRLHLILKENIDWDYFKSPKLSQIINAYKTHHMDEYIHPPEVLHRGSITVSDVLLVDNEETYIQMVYKWAMNVYKAYLEGHEIAKSLSREYISTFEVKA